MKMQNLISTENNGSTPEIHCSECDEEVAPAEYDAQKRWYHAVRRKEMFPPLCEPCMSAKFVKAISAAKEMAFQDINPVDLTNNRVLVTIEGIEYEVSYPANVSKEFATNVFKREYYLLKDEGPSELFRQFVSHGYTRMIVRRELEKCGYNTVVDTNVAVN